jgi:pyruvate formate-lyase/glycerol dehydratase family glycyl radical enzyme
MATQVSEDLLRKIDQLELGDRIRQWQKAMKACPSEIYVDRQKFALESWKETEGEDVEIRRAKLFQKIVENVPIKIHDFDVLVGRLTPGVIGASTAIDIVGDYIPGIWNDDGNIRISVTNEGTLSREDLETLRESAGYFRGKTAPDLAYKALRSLVGTWAEDYEEAKGKDPVLSTGIFPGTSATVMWKKILTRGLRSIIDEAKQNIRNFAAKQNSGIDKVLFWQAVEIVLEAAINHAHRYAKLADDMAEQEKDPVRRDELREIAGICRWVPENPARTFHEALQSMAIVGVCKNLEHPMHYHPHLARADEYLWPYFEQDVKRGNITLEKSAGLLEEIISRWGSQIFVATSSFRQTHQINYGIHNVVVGGVDRNGDEVSNELSYLILHVIGLLKMSSPTVSLRWNHNTPRWLLNKGLETNMKTRGGIPLFQNEDHVIASFVGDGIPVEDAREWFGLGCVQPVVPSRVKHSGCEGAGTINVALVLDLTLHNGVCVVTGKKLGMETGDPRAFRKFDELFDAFKQQFSFIATKVLWLARTVREINEKHLRLPFMSSLITQGCMDAGKDALCPDPSFHIFVMQDRAIVDTADSLMAIKKLVFDEKKLTMDELMRAIDANFEGARGEQIRRLCLAAPKFGNDIDEIDSLVRDLGKFTAGVIRSYDNYPYKNYGVVREGLSWHYFGGLGVGALPNGRKSKEPLNDGSISPMRGADVKGPTAVLRSVLKAGFDEAQASVLNQKFSPSVVQSPESREKMAVYTNAFFKNGGQHIQFNILDTRELLDARVNPEKHKDLIVRVGGFSAYFVQLSPEVQEDIILRTEHSL